MATASVALYPNRIFCGDVDVGGGQLGEFKNITTSASFSLIPGVAPQFFTKYYSYYLVNTDSAISVTVPDIASVSNGWKAKIYLLSPLGTGSLAIIDTSLASIANINISTLSIELVVVGGARYFTFSVPKTALPRQIFMVNGNTPFLTYPMLGRFTSLCDVGGAAVIDVNTLTPTALRWINPSLRVLDTNFYNSSLVTNTGLRVTRNCNLKVDVLIGIANVASATQANLQIRPRINGVTFPDAFVVITGTIQNYTDGVYTLNGAFNLLANDYIEIVINKTVVSAGTNPVDLATTMISTMIDSY